MNKINNPHDTYFKSAMSDRRVAREFFEDHLPPAIREGVNLDSLQLEPSSFIDEELRTSMADILYAVELNKTKGYLYVLVEQQRKPDKLMAYRLLRYMLRIMDHHLKQHGGTTLPVIVPLVFFNGEQQYPYSTDLFHLFGEHEELARAVLLSPFTLVDVTQISDEDLKRRRWAGIMEFVQKHIFARDFMPFLRELLPLLKHLDKAGAKDYVISTLTYLFQADIENPTEVARLISNEVSTALGDEIMSLAERLKHEGLAEGLAKGKAEGRAEGSLETQRNIARNMLAQSADLAFVAKVTGLSIDELKTLLTSE